ncbi:MAG: class I SAM-dependent methyltransferase [Victivallales bacterium]|jgi:SAM-dependent methyltransferase
MKIIRKIKAKLMFYLYLFLGYFVFNSNSYRNKRKKYGTPGKNYLYELKQRSLFLFHLEKSYQEYSEYFYNKYENAIRQQKRWTDYSEIYYKSREEVPLEIGIIEYFQQCHTKKKIIRVLDIGAGGGGALVQFSKLYPQIEFIGLDISEYSQKIFENITSEHPNIKFIKGSILDNLYIIDEIDLFYTYNVLMHLNKNEINKLFQYLSKTSKNVTGIIHEPYCSDMLTNNIQTIDYAHNYLEYFKAYSFKLISKSILNEKFGIYYFENHS